VLGPCNPTYSRLGHNLRDSGGRFDLETMVGEFRRTLHEEMVRFLMAVSEGDGEEVLDRDTGPGARSQAGVAELLSELPGLLWGSFRRDCTGLASPGLSSPRLPSPPLASPPP